MKKKWNLASVLAVIAVITLSSCTAPTQTPVALPSVQPSATAWEQPAETPAATEGASEFSSVVEYNLGETKIVQKNFPEDSTFREMPLLLNGLIAVPAGEGGPFPLVVVLHGNHPGCPLDSSDVDRWPCDREVEQPNYRGFDYLLQTLADNGYVALSMNINAENTLGFGEPIAGERLGQIFDQHMQALAKAASGGENLFGVDLNGRVDLSRIVLVGHSRGGEESVRLARELNDEKTESVNLPYGPISGLVLLASAVTAVNPDGGIPVPTAIILPVCDGDVISQDGQHFFEAARLAPQQTERIISVWLEQANHNFFNRNLGPDPFWLQDRPDCSSILEPGEQQQFLTAFIPDFLATLFSQDAEVASAASERLGLNIQSPVVEDLYGFSARVALLTQAEDRVTIMIPAAETELSTNLQGGAVTEVGVTTHFCPAGFYTPEMLPGSEACRRATVTIPGQPALAYVTWQQPGGEWQFTLPQGAGDISGFTTITVRAALDPLSDLNAPGEFQAFSLQLTDSSGKIATLKTKTDEPALVFPPGNAVEDDFFGSHFTGIVPLTDIRFNLEDFSGIDLTNITQVTILFDQTQSGALYIADLGWVRPTQP